MSRNGLDDHKRVRLRIISSNFDDIGIGFVTHIHRKGTRREGTEERFDHKMKSGTEQLLMNTKSRENGNDFIRRLERHARNDTSLTDVYTLWQGLNNLHNGYTMGQDVVDGVQELVLSEDERFMRIEIAISRITKRFTIDRNTNGILIH